MAAKNSIFIGTFIHSRSLDVLEYLHDTAIFVNEKGIIVRIEPACDREKAEKILAPKLGWSADEFNVTIAQDEQFFFPGFIGAYSHFVKEYRKLTISRHTYPCITVPQRRYLWQIHSPRLAKHLYLPHGSLSG